MSVASGDEAKVRPLITCDFRRFVPRVAAGLAALTIALSLPASGAFADGGEERTAGDTGDDSYATDDEAGDIAVQPSATVQGGGFGGLTVEGLVLGRKDLETVPFTTDSGVAGRPFVPFDSSELKGEDYSAGLRGTLQGTIFDQPVEFSAFWINPIGVEATKLNLGQEAGNPADTDTVYDDAPGSDISSVNSDNIFGLTVHHETKLYGGEANLVRPFGIPGLLIGVRGIYFGEQIGSTTMDTEDDVPWLGNDDVRDHVSIRADNYLLGMQVGFQHMFDIGSSVRIGGSVKAGLYNNFVDRNRTFVSENRPDLRSFDNSDSGNVFAQGVEINPRIEFQLDEGVILTASGTFMWLNNVSTALPHYASVEDLDDHDIRANDDTYFYGGSLGLTFLFDTPSTASSGGFAPIGVDFGGSPAATFADVEDRIAELEDTAARRGNDRVSLEVSGYINRMLMAWDDGQKQDVYIVDNTAARSRLEFTGAAKIARGWSAGYYLSVGLDDVAANDVDQFNADGEADLIELRHSAWWLRSNRYGTVTVGHTSTATDNIILKDVGGIMPGAANIATIGGSLIVRRADEPELGSDALITRTTLNDFSAGASVDTLRRNVVRYDAPRISGPWGNVYLSAAWGEDDFYDFALEHSLNYNDWKFRFGAGYLRDTTENGRANSRRDREEYKGSASLLHIPTGLFGTVAYVHREFNGFDTSNQAVFGENTVGLVTPPGTNRPPIDYLYSAFGLRRNYWSIGETSIYGEYAQVDDAITGLREADLREVTDSRLQMVGAAISQNIDAAAMDVYVGFRYYTFDAEGVQLRKGVPTPPSPAPLSDIVIGYAGTRIKF